MRKELIQVKKSIPLSFEEQVNHQFELAKNVLTQLKQFKKEEPELYRFLNQEVLQAISTANPLWIKWIFLATTELFWLYMMNSPDDLKLVRDDGDGEDRIDNEIAELISIKTDCLLEEGLNYFDLTATEVNLINKEVIKDDRRFVTTRIKLQEQLRNYQAEKSYSNLSGLIWSYLELGRINEALTFIETVNPENDLDQDQIADLLRLYCQLIDLISMGQIEFKFYTLDNENITRLLNHLKKQQDSFKVSDEKEPFAVQFIWLQLIEKFIGWNDLGWNNIREKTTQLDGQLETHIKNSHDQVLMTLVDQSDNPIERLSVYSCFSLSNQCLIEQEIFNQKLADKLEYFRFHSCFFRENAFWEDFEPIHWEFRDQIYEQLLEEFPVAEKAIKICYLRVLWEQELRYWEAQKLTALKTLEAFGDWFQNLKQNGHDQKFDYIDARILRWLLKSWIITETEQPIQEMMGFLFNNLDFCRRWLGGMLGILFSRNCYDLIIDIGENILKLAELEDQLSSVQIEACEKWLIVMAWTYAFQDKEDEIEKIYKICETTGKRLMIDDGCIEEIKAIKSCESCFFYEDPDAFDLY